MNIKNLVSVFACAVLSAMALHVNASNVNLNSARSVANSFIKLHSAATAGSFKAPAAADLKLAHIEASSADNTANVYYAFNIDGDKKTIDCWVSATRDGLTSVTCQTTSRR